MRTVLAILLCATVLTVLSGCTRTVYVKGGEPIRIREPIHNAPVWIIGQNGKPLKGHLTIPEGWYALPDPGP